MRCGSDSIHRHTVVDDGVVIDGVVIHHGRLFVNVTDFGVSHSVMTQVVIAEVMHAHEGEVFCMQPEVETDTDADAVVPPAVVSVKIGVRRQWRPAAVRARGAPAYPGGSPCPIW